MREATWAKNYIPAPVVEKVRERIRARSPINVHTVGVPLAGTPRRESREERNLIAALNVGRAAARDPTFWNTRGRTRVRNLINALCAERDLGKARVWKHIRGSTQVKNRINAWTVGSVSAGVPTLHPLWDNPRSSFSQKSEFTVTYPLLGHLILLLTFRLNIYISLEIQFANFGSGFHLVLKIVLREVSVLHARYG